MINASETQAPAVQIKRIINSGETIPPGITDRGKVGRKFSAGESISDDYVISSLMEKNSSQSDIYFAKRWGKTYVVKVYKDGWHPSTKMQNFLANIQHPNIVHVEKNGNYHGNYYEIYEYYPEGTLEEVGPLSPVQIEEIIIPSINEGLHEIHEKGVVHCDIKPGNLFYSNDRKSILIGDFGISGFVDSDGKFLDLVRGTPEYAPPVKSLVMQSVMTPAFDYGSFGLVLCKLVLGHSLFEGMSVEEIARAWEAGLELPGKITGRLGLLIRGLLNRDEEQRWGYNQVKRWCEGEYQKPVNRNIYLASNEDREIRPMTFGRFDNQIISVSTLHQLAMAIREHWEQGTRIIKRRELLEFVDQFDNKLTDKVRALSMVRDADVAVFKLLALIDDPQNIFFCGKDYGSLENYVNSLASGRDEEAKKFLIKGLLVFYLRENKYEKVQVDRLEEFLKQNGSRDMSSVTTVCFELLRKSSFDFKDVSVETLDDLVPLLTQCSVAEIAELMEWDEFIAWMNRIGYKNDIRKMKEMFDKK